MATAQELLSGLQEYYPYIATDGNLMNELNRRAGEGATVDDILAGSSNYSEIGIGARRRAESLYGPQYDFTVNQLNLEDQGLNQMGVDVNRQADFLGQQLQEQAVKSRGTLTENFNNLGLLQSGMTAAGLGDVEKKLSQGVKETEADRASRLAQIALQRAGIGIQRAQAANQKQTSVDALVAELLGGSKKALEQPAQQIDLGDRVVLLNSKGKVIQEFKKRSLSGGGAGGAGGAMAGLLEALGLGQQAGAAGAEGEIFKYKSPEEARKAITQDVRQWFLDNPQDLLNGYSELEFLPLIYQSAGDVLPKEEIDQLFYQARARYDDPNNVLNPNFRIPEAPRMTYPNSPGSRPGPRRR